MQELRPTPRAIPLDAIRTELDLAHLHDEVVVTGIALDTRLVQPGDLFAALPGANTHGARFAHAAVAAGAVAVLTDPAGHAIADVAVPILVVDDPRAHLGALARTVYSGPRPRLIGVTGTNGKTTTTYCVAALAAAAAVPTAVVGTLGARFGALDAYSGRTTPEAPSLHATLTAFAEAGAQMATMEVSSHALSLHRVDGLFFDVAVFLGLTQDHLDFHHTMDDYFAAKARLFSPDMAGQGVINIDDDWGKRLAAATSIPYVTVSTSQSADWTADDVRSDAHGHTLFTAVGPGVRVPVQLPMPGGFNVANALAALASMHAVGADVSAAADGLALLRVPGRFEFIANDRGVAAYVDYAHTPDAVERVLSVARGATKGRLITVLGCGGDRDASKRPAMGACATALSDLVFVTDDNPRSEDPAAIRAQVLAGAPESDHIREIGDRHGAIAAAVAEARTGDCIMVLGKGHETGQEIAGVMHPFDDRAELRQALGVAS